MYSRKTLLNEVPRYLIENAHPRCLHDAVLLQPLAKTTIGRYARYIICDPEKRRRDGESLCGFFSFLLFVFNEEAEVKFHSRQRLALLKWLNK